MNSNAEINEVDSAKQALMLSLGDKWAMYLTNMKLWFRKKYTKEEFDLECRKLFSPHQLHLHNRFLLAMLNKIDAVTAPQSTVNHFDGSQMASAAGVYGSAGDGTSYSCLSAMQQHDGRSNKKRKRSSKSLSDRATFEPMSPYEYIPREANASDHEHSASTQCGMVGGATLPTLRYAAQELFLPDNGLVLGRLLVGAWEHGLASADDAAVELIVNSVQILLKNILTAVITARKNYRVTAKGTFYYDVGHELKHPFVRNTVTKSKIDDEPMELDREIICYVKTPPTDSTFLANCEQLYPTVNRKINALELYRALEDRNLISSHSFVNKDAHKRKTAAIFETEKNIVMSRKDWQNQLVRELADEKLHLKSTSKSIAIMDVYPKARHHFLVLPRKEIDTLHELTIHDIDLLEDMYQLGRSVIKEKGLDEEQFNYGYHLNAHMKRLHLHVISRDFDSPCLKRRRHWTIFNSEIFQSHDAVLKELKTKGTIRRRSDAYLHSLHEGPLR
uniref:HIT domain-containing protein n=1 Tax=Anopheles dirus TaxID=7168 RepID=A0A182N5J0_9DIPT